MPLVRIIDVTNRDGVQTARLGLAKIEKTIINKFLNEFGVYMSECGFPATEHEWNYINGNVALVEKGVFAPMHLGGWIRAMKEDVKVAKEFTKINHLNLSASTSDIMIEGKYAGKRTRDDVLNDLVEALNEATDLGFTRIGVNAEDGSRTSMDFLLRFAAAAQEYGAERFRYCDTLGCESPKSIYQRISTIAKELGMPVEMHCHNDLGLAVGNSIEGARACIDAGVDTYVDTTINGIGERAGNADLISSVLALKYANDNLSDYMDPDIDLSASWRITNYASYAFKVPIPINQPGVGANAFAHASGIHADGIIKDNKNYELYDFTELGRGELEYVETGRNIIVGEYSGIAGFKHVMEDFGVTFKDDPEARYALKLSRYANVLKQKPLVKEELIFIAQHPKEMKEILTMAPL
ncbi:MAG TPA: homocitrate synthase [Candidatus Lokiarchaeia archaeon]|nr:homocitrate synthase [Candidatus Lokiarchaeia archaeon]